MGASAFTSVIRMHVSLQLTEKGFFHSLSYILSKESMKTLSYILCDFIYVISKLFAINFPRLLTNHTLIIAH